MSQKNLEQIRAQKALSDASSLSKSAINKLPAMIITNGLLATAAFCDAEGGGDNRKDMKAALNATAEHLAQRNIIDNQAKTIQQMIKELTSRNSHDLQRATTESLAFIAYLKRFAPKE